MPKVKNLTKETVHVQRWKFLPDGRVMDPRGNLKGAVPDDVAYSAAAKRLADQGVLDIEGYRPKKPTPKVGPAPAVVKVEAKVEETSKEKPKKDKGK